MLKMENKFLLRQIIH